VGFATVAVPLMAVTRDERLAYAEALANTAGTPASYSAQGRGEADEETIGSLETRKARLEAALRRRPDWAEGHLRLGVTLLDLYRRTAAELLAEPQRDPKSVAMMSDPVWLLGLVHSTGPGERPTTDELMKHDPIRLYLAPAARSFLEARRCSPFVALAHARIASLDFLLERADPPSAYLERALLLAGAQSQVLDLIAQVAVEVDDLPLAARCWRRRLEVNPLAWDEVADDAGSTLPPEQLLDQVLPWSGRSAVMFAERLYPKPEQTAPRELFLRAALERLPHEALPEAERLQLVARARAGLGDRASARQQMESALDLEPLRREWRKTLVRWSLAWGDWDVARSHALAGLRIEPGDVDLQTAVEVATDALARGGTMAAPGPPLLGPVAGSR
jgi:hypothetical protein